MKVEFTFHGVLRYTRLQRPGASSLLFVAIVVLLVIQFASFSPYDNDRWSLLLSSVIEPKAAINTTTTTTTTPNLLLNITNRTLVIVMGNLRCGEPAWTTLKERVLDVNSADLALMLGYTMPRYLNSSLFDRAKFVWSFPEHEDWGHALDEMEINERKRIAAVGTATTISASSSSSMMLAPPPPPPSWRETVLPRLRASNVFGGVKTPNGGCCAGGGAPQYVARYHIQERIRELDLTSYYDRFIIARSDSYYKFNINLAKMMTMDENDEQEGGSSIWIPSGCQDGCDFGGLNDRQMIVSSADVMTVLDGFPRLVRGDARNYTDQALNTNSESFLLDSLRRGGVADKVMRYPQPFYTCMMPGDQASWGSNMMLGQDGVYVKKPREYNPVKGRFGRCGGNPDCSLRIL